MANEELARLFHNVYPKMIMKAIEVIGARDGSCRDAISSYIVQAYGYLPSTHSRFLAFHLNRMTLGGELVLRNNNYMLKPNPVEPPRSGRGRGVAKAVCNRKSRGRPANKKEDQTQKNAGAGIKEKLQRKSAKAAGSVREWKEGVRRSERIRERQGLKLS